MVTERLTTQKNVDHLNIVKLFNYQKIQMLNYFTALGKLKALFKIQQVNKKPITSIKDMFLESIKKLNLKLERVDVQLTNNMQKLAVKQSIK